jgi:uncharacterized protein (DUF488 family)
VIERVITIGAYGFTRETFLAALANAGVDLFVDVRARRGVRGSEYAFVNSKRLQESLKDSGVEYVHALELAPPQSVRDVQAEADRAGGIAKRARSVLGPEFIQAYTQQCLCGFDARAFVNATCRNARRPVFFCVERDAAACHRSLLAQQIGDQLSVPVLNLSP